MLVRTFSTNVLDPKASWLDWAPLAYWSHIKFTFWKRQIGSSCYKMSVSEFCDTFLDQQNDISVFLDPVSLLPESASLRRFSFYNIKCVCHLGENCCSGTSIWFAREWSNFTDAGWARNSQLPQCRMSNATTYVSPIVCSVNVNKFDEMQFGPIRQRWR